VATIKGKLSEKKIARARSAGRPAKLGDGHGRGLYLEVKSPTAASWVLRWERHGREQTMGLGSAEDVTLGEARDAAREARKLIKAGIDPIDKRRKEDAAEQAARARAWTFGQVVDEYFKTHEPSWSRSHAEQWSCQMRGKTLRGTSAEKYYAKSLSDVPVAMVDVPLVRSVLQPIWHEMRVTASRLRNRIEAVLDLAAALELRAPDNPARALGKLMPRAPKGEERPHYASLPYAQMPSFMETLRTRCGSDAMAFQFMVLTAARSKEALGATWNEIDLDGSDGPVWVVPPTRMKAGKQHVVPLAPDVVELLRELPRELGNDHLFIGSRPGHGLSPSVLQKLLRRKLAQPEITAHGFRSAFSTWAYERSGAKRDVIERCLAHTVGSATEQAYNRAEHLEARRRLLDAWARFCASPMPTSGENVVPIAAGAAR
jgi:integrase